MATDLRFTKDGMEPVSPGEALEVVALHSRNSAGIDRPDGRTLATVADVAETLDIDVAAARQLLGEVRERQVQSQTSGQRSSPSAFAFLGWAVAGLAIAFAGYASMTEGVRAAPVVANTVPLGTDDSDLTDIAVLPTESLPPPGYSVQVKGRYIRLRAPGPDETSPVRRDQVRRRLIDSSLRLVQQAQSLDSDRTFRSIMSARSSTMRQGYVELWISGGNMATQIPIAPAMSAGPQGIAATNWLRQQVSRTVDELLDGYAKHQIALTPTGGGNVEFPPPGFEMLYEGRRSAGLMGGGGGLMAPYDHAAVKRKLVAAMRGLMERDLQPIPGQWRQGAEAEKKLKTPEFGRFTVWTTRGAIRFSVPVSNKLGPWYEPKFKESQARSLEDVAEKLVEGVDRAFGKGS